MSSLCALTAWLRQQCYIGGVWCHADSGETIEVTDPGNGELLGSVPKMGSGETARAFAAAAEAPRITPVSGELFMWFFVERALGSPKSY